MKLSDLNMAPTYTMVLPSTGKEVKFRPFIVKEEVALHLAKESNDPKSYLAAVEKLIYDCSYEQIDPKKLTSFDIETFFVRLRERSVGSEIELVFPCTNEKDGKICNYNNDVIVNLEEVKVNDKIQKDIIIKLNNMVSVEMQYPSFATLETMALANDKKDITKIIITMIKTIFTDTEVFVVADLSEKDTTDFLERLTSKQFAKLNNFFKDIPTISYTVSYKCPKCGQIGQHKFQGLYDFFAS